MPIKAKLFYLQRDKDISGVSGIGNVADGVEFANGMCALSFHSEFPHCNVYLNMRALLEVHGHEGATKIVFVEVGPPVIVCCTTCGGSGYVPGFAKDIIKCHDCQGSGSADA
mgnify:CR=1 FL=1